MSVRVRRQRPAPGRPERQRTQGQALVEFAILIPMFMLLLMGMLEFGLAFSHHQTLQYATREGARAGAVYLPNDPNRAFSEAKLAEIGRASSRERV